MRDNRSVVCTERESKGEKRPSGGNGSRKQKSGSYDLFLVSLQKFSYFQCSVGPVRNNV